MEDRRGGRGNRRPIDWKKVDEYYRAHCSGQSIASIVGVHYTTLARRIEEKYGMLPGDYAALRRAEGVSIVQMAIYKDAVAKGGSDRIFWLKNKAGWKDQWSVDHTTGGNPFSNLSDDEIIQRLNKILTTACPN